MSSRVVYHAGHAVMAGGHGGNRRVMQLLELFGQCAGELEVRTDKVSGSAWWNVSKVARGAVPDRSGPSLRYLSLRSLRRYGIMQGIGSGLNVQRGTVHVFDSSVTAYSVVFDRIRNAGGKVIVAPQNLDSLSPKTRDPYSWKVSPHWVPNEIAALRRADNVITISREEQWLLSLYGVPSLFLPYEPTLEVRKQLLQVREQRAGGDKDVVLILGTAGNTPTRDALRTLFGRASDVARAAEPRRVIVVGFGTETFQPLTVGSSVRVLGGVSEETLRTYLVRASVCLVYQGGTTGALTRIREMLYCGVPVIANSIAARSYHGVEGLLVVESLEEMIQALAAKAPWAVPVPKAESGLNESVARLITNLAEA